MNVELEKAQSNEINCTYEIAETLKIMHDGNIISLIANLCDNAIEYLVQIPQEQRQMSLSIQIMPSSMTAASIKLIVLLNPLIFHPPFLFYPCRVTALPIWYGSSNSARYF